MTDSALTTAYLNLVEKWASSSTSHGIPKMIQSKNRLIKVMWGLFFLASFAYCLFTLVKSFTQYFSYPTTRQIGTARDALTEFPAVTICNLSPYNYFAKQTLIDSILEKNNLTYGRDWTEIVDANDPLRIYKDFFTKLNGIIAADYGSNASFRQSLGFDLEKEMLLSCTYNKNPCKTSDFTYFWSNKYGNCYTFNSNKYTNGTLKDILKTSRSGRDYGLRLELLIGNPLGFGTSNLLYYLTFQLGLFVVVHDNDIPPQLITEGVTVPAGTDTYIPIKRTLYQKESKPYSNCVDSLEKFKKVNKYSSVLESYMEENNLTQYRQDFCFKFCFQDNLVNKCDCCDTTLPLLQNKSYCRSDIEISCLKNATEIFLISNLDELCQYACVPQCNKMQYKLTEYMSAYPTDTYFSQLLNASFYIDSTNAFQILKLSFRGLLLLGYGVFEAVQIARELFVKVSINYEDLTYTVIQDSPLITTETLFGLLGGQLGLFIGISFLSLVELIELAIKAFLIYQARKKRA